MDNVYHPGQSRGRKRPAPPGFLIASGNYQMPIFYGKRSDTATFRPICPVDGQGNPTPSMVWKPDCDIHADPSYQFSLPTITTFAAGGDGRGGVCRFWGSVRSQDPNYRPNTFHFLNVNTTEEQDKMTFAQIVMNRVEMVASSNPQFRYFWNPEDEMKSALSTPKTITFVQGILLGHTSQKWRKATPQNPIPGILAITGRGVDSLHGHLFAQKEGWAMPQDPGVLSTWEGLNARFQWGDIAHPETGRCIILKESAPQNNGNYTWTSYEVQMTDPSPLPAPHHAATYRPASEIFQILPRAELRDRMMAAADPTFANFIRECLVGSDIEIARVHAPQQQAPSAGPAAPPAAPPPPPAPQPTAPTPAPAPASYQAPPAAPPAAPPPAAAPPPQAVAPSPAPTPVPAPQVAPVPGPAPVSAPAPVAPPQSAPPPAPSGTAHIPAEQPAPQDLNAAAATQAARDQLRGL